MKTKRIVDPAHLARVRRLPCLACEQECREQDSPTEAHHIKRKADGSRYGMGQKAHDTETIPLCRNRHHWNGVNVHMSMAEFESRYGNERDLLAKTVERLADESE